MRSSRKEMPTRWIAPLILAVILHQAVAQCPNNRCALNRNSPCGRLVPGNADLPTFDLIREFHLDESESRYEGVSEIQGSIASQRAYRLQKQSNLTINSFQAFPRGIPHQFSFESTFRTRLQPSAPWYLFHVTDTYESSQLSVTLDPIQQLIGIGLPDVLGNVQRVYFRHSSLFDRSWHKVMLSVARDQATLWVDCIPVVGARGEYYEPLLPRRAFDTSGGHVYVSHSLEETVQSTPLIDLQWMVLSCDATRPARQNCDELPQYQAATRPEEPSIIPPPLQSQPNQCPIVCPQGPPGRDGIDGAPGIPGGSAISAGIKGEKGEQGFPGIPGQSIVGETGPAGLFGERGERGEQGLQGERGFDGQKGERGFDGIPGINGLKGEPGIIITKTEGETYSFNEIQIRDICASVLREQISEIKSSLIGPEGPPGPPGKTRVGRPGPSGQKGEAGIAGAQGLPGLPGPKGHPGLDGLQGEKGERGEDGIGRVGPPGQPGIQGIPGIDIIGPPGHPGPRGEEGRTGSPGPRGEAGTPGQCPNDCYYTMQYMQQLQAAQSQQQQSKGPTPLNLNFKG